MSFDTTVGVDRETLAELHEFKGHDDTYNDVIRRLMAECDHLRWRPPEAHAEQNTN